MVYLFSSVLGLAMLALWSHFISAYLWFEASTGDLVMVVSVAWMALVLVIALPETLLVAGLVLHPTVGPAPDNTGGDWKTDDKQTGHELRGTELAAAFFQPRGLILSLLFLTFVGVNFGFSYLFSNVQISQLVSGESFAIPALAPKGHLSALTDQREVHLVVQSRSNDVHELKSWFRQVSGLGKAEELGLVLPRVAARMRDSRPEVARGACRVMATLGDRMNQNLRLLSGRPLGKRWEPDLLAWLRTRISPELRLRLGQPELEEIATQGLAWIANPDDGDTLQDLLLDVEQPFKVRRQAATGLANMLREEDLGVLGDLARAGTGDEELDLRVIWVLNRFGLRSDPHSLSPLSDKLIARAVADLTSKLQDTSPAIRCAAVTALQAFQDLRATDAAIALFPSPAADILCPRVEIPRPWGGAIPFVRRKLLRFKLLNLLASIAIGNDKLYRWVLDVSQQDRWKPLIRDGLLTILSRIERHRDQ